MSDGAREVADRIVKAAHEYEGNDPGSGAGNFLFQVRSALAEQAGEEREFAINRDRMEWTLKGPMFGLEPGESITVVPREES